MSDRLGDRHSTDQGSKRIGALAARQRRRAPARGASTTMPMLTVHAQNVC
ncbi:hypothetical protein LPH50_07375 [Xylella taiwanensis]|uniref:Uncharacterized protein n=1 Tax=Xylella taiwanensis TaxID=1444770 RepID=A0ABS8TSN2_9GAMM|nr:hypothetical protein [Xylella taiwanensis]MCD8455778.1 hypothetical protein [Xylella taiwanensis]MCD8458183.1 hypothetical protein [Xylella taiwanensis]MCD8460319.1 hypothetical protein [Xylella taiwanensis]MCD8463623.1 hypothetical protein [Xylella taiwanensis]MCD8464821.1 hypothetical protein [Xylella taiwanensis]